MSGEVKINGRTKQIIVEALRIERCNGRRDTVKQKGRGEVSGGGSKPWRQKGTGRARQGSTRAPHWVGGGRAFGSAIENHGRKINKKVRRQAVKSVIDWKIESGKVVIGTLPIDKPSTKSFRNYLAEKGVAGKVLFIYNSEPASQKMKLSARNLPNVATVHSDAINIEGLINCEWIVTTPEIAEKLNIVIG